MFGCFLDVFSWGLVVYERIMMLLICCCFYRVGIFDCVMVDVIDYVMV